VLALVSPSGVKTTANTDANGQFNLTLLEKGTYTVTLVKESRQVNIPAFAAPVPEAPSLPTVIYNDIVGSLLWLLVALVAIVGLVVYTRYWRGRGGKKAPPSS
jgi:hypothetical protein